ncbi:hypothetical protein FS749_002989 [Ceratobasidium sp. UAMH 11750]|nr:hypothetical protein FS749_002989 [Ceratobasidium sp. UAMH 11750]
MWLLYVAHLVFDTILFVITVWKVWASSRVFGSSPLMQRLAENGALHSGVLVALMVFACIGGTIDTLSVPSNGSGLLGAMSSVVCSRNIFSLHTLAEEERKRRMLEVIDENVVGTTRVSVPMKEFNSTTSASASNGRSSFLYMTDSKPGRQSNV